FLLIGWQAQEAHFLKMWAEARSGQDTQVFIVDRDLEAGKVVGENVRRGGLRRINNHVYEGKLWKDRNEYDFHGFQSFSRRDDLRRIVSGDHHWMIYG
ncbi:MAG: hypothetical protein JWO69_1527, partial [Thermoleophilia bacterium]|nr:hypothetical protein [Thermoleophilia bacterium]